jgi:hypothetical protein
MILDRFSNPVSVSTKRRCLSAALSLITPASAQAAVVAYEGQVLPEDAGFSRVTQYDPVRWCEDGWFYQEIDVGGGTGEPYDGDYDDYRWPLADFVGAPYFVEWRMQTDAPDSEVDWHNGGAFMVSYGGGVNFHFNMASGLARLLRGYPYPTEYFEIEPGIPHTYRLEVYDGDYFEFRIDGALMDFGQPEDVFPTPDAELFFGARYYQSEHTTQWDYVHFGTIPEPTTGLLLVFGTAVVVLRRRLRCE